MFYFTDIVKLKNIRLFYKHQVIFFLIINHSLPVNKSTTLTRAVY